jgi:Protein of unknown function (DUF742)
VSTPSAPVNLASRKIVLFFETAGSVAEIAGGLGVPVGVARVLNAALPDERLVAVRDQLHTGELHTR